MIRKIDEYETYNRTHINPTGQMYVRHTIKETLLNCIFQDLHPKLINEAMRNMDFTVIYDLIHILLLYRLIKCLSNIIKYIAEVFSNTYLLSFLLYGGDKP